MGIKNAGDELSPAGVVKGCLWLGIIITIRNLGSLHYLSELTFNFSTYINQI